MSARWKMNRIGFVNFWLYDEESFDFADGKLLLRGQNGSGKSITTQSFIPFILDGDRTPSRLDPFGSSDRRMEYYFLGEEGKDEATGYLFLEFYKESTGEYRTLGIGQRARRGKQMDFWGFVILDGRRVGFDIQFYKESGSSRILCDRADMKKLLGEENPFTDNQTEYKNLVNRYLFGFRKPEQYEQFIRLLVKVRAPKLSKEFKPTKVYDILNESLQTLTDEDLRPMVDAMEKMDGIQGSLELLKKAFADLGIIRNEYIRYNQYMLAQKAQVYLGKRQKVQQVKTKFSEQEELQQEMIAEQKQCEERCEELDRHQSVIETELEGLYDPELENLDRKLEKALEEKKTAQQNLAEKQRLIDKCQEDIREKEGLIREKEELLEQQRSDLEEQKEELEEYQETLQWDRHGDVRKMLSLEQPEAEADIHAELEKLRKSISSGKDAIRGYEEAQKAYDKASEKFEEVRKDRQNAEKAVEAAAGSVTKEQDQLVEKFFLYAEESKIWKPAQDTLLVVESQLREYEELTLESGVRALLQADYDEQRAAWMQKALVLRNQLQSKEDQILQLKTDLDVIWNQKELEPERDTRVEKSRQQMDACGIMGFPFYKTVEYKEDMEETSRALLESQLDKLGILDALVVRDADYRRIQKEFPELRDTLVYAEQAGTSGFDGLTVSGDLDEEMKEVVCRILSNLYVDTNAGSSLNQESSLNQRNSQNTEGFGGIYLRTDGTYGHGILTGRTDDTREAAYIGRLAREKKRLKRIRELEAALLEVQTSADQLKTELDRAEESLEVLKREYGALPDFKALNQAVSRMQLAELELQNIRKRYKELETELNQCVEKRQKKYQLMLQACKELPYGRTMQEYEEAEEAAESYRNVWYELQKLLRKMSDYRSEILHQKELIENIEDRMDEAFVEKRKYVSECSRLEVVIRQCREYLDSPEVKEQAQKVRGLKEKSRKIEEELEKLHTRRTELRVSLGTLEKELSAQKDELKVLIGDETCLRKYFEEELDLKLVMERSGRGLAECAAEAVRHLRETDRGRGANDLTASLFRVYQNHNSSLISYRTELEEWFHTEPDEVLPSDGQNVLRTRHCFAANWNGKKLYLEDFYQLLKNGIEETEQLIRKEDRRLFEEILSQTISRQLTDRIAESRRWVKDMSELMKNLDTSMGLTFSLDWRPRSAENEGELDTSDLEKILRMDPELLSQEDIERIAGHFRSKIQTEKQKLEEMQTTVNYMDLVRDALDYRKWFEFRMFYRRGQSEKKQLTNAAFNRYSGGEKAMAMYVPLFAAVNAQYQKTSSEDYPRMIALDEAFAGIDEKNISSMFELVKKLDFDYIMNSQALWGCYDTVPALGIAELLRPQDSQVVTVIRYTWNGHERIMDVQ